jgi:hypothetical protein
MGRVMGATMIFVQPDRVLATDPPIAHEDVHQLVSAHRCFTVPEELEFHHILIEEWVFFFRVECFDGGHRGDKVKGSQGSREQRSKGSKDQGSKGAKDQRIKGSKDQGRK